MGNMHNRQRGAVMIMTATLIVVLIGIAALALDLGRLFVLKTEMQNAADAAALAAAAELDGNAGARARAMAAAKEVLTHQGHFAEDPELLGNALPSVVDTNPAVAGFVFYCAIGSKYDLSGTCDGATDPHTDANHILPAGTSESALDRDTHYVKVKLHPNASAPSSYIVDLIYLPVIALITGNAPQTGSAGAQATAGRHFFLCRFPVTLMCDPFEGTGSSFKEVMVGKEGSQIVLKEQSEFWHPGNFGFLEAKVGGPGANALSNYLVKDNDDVCDTNIVTTEPGGMTNKTANAINTRFDIYTSGGFSYDSDWPPAPDVIEYPRDSNIASSSTRIGNGIWDRDGYWNTFHAWQAGHLKPANWSNMTRYEAYQWEIDNNKLPSKEPLDTTDDPSYDGIPGHTAGVPERRLIYLTFLSCDALGIGGKETISVLDPDGFAKVFVTESVCTSKNPSSKCNTEHGHGHGHEGEGEEGEGASTEKADLYVEFVSWTDDEDANYHVDIQLYE